MRHELEYIIQDLLWFALVCFLVISFFFIYFYLIAKHQHPSSKKPYKIIGIFAEFSPIEVFSLSLLTIRQIYFLWLLFHFHTSLVYLFVLILPGFIYGVLNRKLLSIFLDPLNCGLLYFALVIKNILYKYIIDIASSWHVVVFFVMLIIFAVLYSSYFYFRSVRAIANENIRRLRSENLVQQNP